VPESSIESFVNIASKNAPNVAPADPEFSMGFSADPACIPYIAPTTLLQWDVFSIGREVSREEGSNKGIFDRPPTLTSLSWFMSIYLPNGLLFWGKPPDPPGLASLKPLTCGVLT
jgi:hypothetical protein